MTLVGLLGSGPPSSMSLVAKVQSPFAVLEFEIRDWERTIGAISELQN